jgi:hypothetical protein
MRVTARASVVRCPFTLKREIANKNKASQRDRAEIDPPDFNKRIRSALHPDRRATHVRQPRGACS